MSIMIQVIYQSMIYHPWFKNVKYQIVKIKHLHRIHSPLRIHHRHLILFKISIMMIIIILQQQQYIIIPLQLCIERIIMAQELIIHLLPPPIRILLHHSISIIIITIPTIITITLMHHVYHVHYHPTQDQSQSSVFHPPELIQPEAVTMH